MQITAVVSNHLDLRPMAEREGIRFIYLTVTKESKSQQEGELMSRRLRRADGARCNHPDTWTRPSHSATIAGVCSPSISTVLIVVTRYLASPR